MAKGKKIGNIGKPRKKGHLVYVDGKGDIYETPMARGGKKATPKKRTTTKRKTTVKKKTATKRARRR